MYINMLSCKSHSNNSIGTHTRRIKVAVRTPLGGEVAEANERVANHHPKKGHREYLSVFFCDVPRIS